MRALGILIAVLLALAVPAAAEVDLGTCAPIGVVTAEDGSFYRQFVCSSGAIVLVPTDCRDPLLPEHLICKES